MLHLCACATVEQSFAFSQQRENIKSIEIYAPAQPYTEGNIHLLKEENQPVAVLDGDALSDCLDSIEQLTFKKEKVFFPIPMDGGCDYQGYVLMIVYQDSGYDLIAEGGFYSYAVGNDGQGRHKYDPSDYCGEVAWSDLVEKYIEK